MPKSAEALPESEDELDTNYVRRPGEKDVEAHLTNVPHVYEQDGEDVELPDTGNFPRILHAYMLNRFGYEGTGLDEVGYQRQLREYKLGHLITKAIDAVYDIDRASLIDPALRAPLRDSQETHTTHRIVMEEMTPYLHPSIEPVMLEDPPHDDLEAA